MIGIVALVVGIVLGIVFRPDVPDVVAPYLPIAVVAALDAVFGGLRAYLNRCAHAPVELDWPEGRFFDESGLYLVCATHGAMYRAEDGSCAGGPCHGRNLVTLEVREGAGQVWVAFENGSP